MKSEEGKRLLRGDYTQFTPSGKALFVKAGQYFKKPKKGDIVYFYSKTKGRVAHVGLVIEVAQFSVDQFSITTIEGNTSMDRQFNRNGGAVVKKTYLVRLFEIGNGNRIDGFGRPEYGPDTASSDEMISVAKEELGYIEKNSMTSLDDKLANIGEANYTKYGKWYGYTPAYWCQQFISWIANKACELHKANYKVDWEKLKDGWKFKIGNNYAKNQWKYIDGRWYAFDGAGYAISGWFLSNDCWYYMNPADYAMLAGQWIKDKGKDYYLDKTGALVTNAYIKGNNTYNFVNDKGEWDKSKDTDNPDRKNWEIIE